MQFLKWKTTNDRFSFPFFSFQPYRNQVSEACSTDTSGPTESGFSSEGEDYSVFNLEGLYLSIQFRKNRKPESGDHWNKIWCFAVRWLLKLHEFFIYGIGSSSIDGQAVDLPQSIPPEASVQVKPSRGPLEVRYSQINPIYNHLWCLRLSANDKRSLVKKYLSSSQPLERWNVQRCVDSHCTESWFEEMGFEHLISSLWCILVQFLNSPFLTLHRESWTQGREVKVQDQLLALA